MKTKKSNIKDYIAAAKRGEREARLENATGFVATTKIAKSKKVYSRKNFKIEID